MNIDPAIFVNSLRAFRSDLDVRLGSLTPPASLSCSDPLYQDTSHTEERDSYVLDVMSNLIEVSHLTIPLSGGGKLKQGNKCSITENIPGWEVEVEPFKQDAVFWHSIILQSGDVKIWPMTSEQESC